MKQVALAAAVAALIVTGCNESTDVATGDVDRYCALTQELDEAGEEAFAPLEKNEEAKDEDFARAQQQFLAAHEDDFDELREVVPDEIKEDLATLLEAQEKRAEGDFEPSSEEEQAEQRIKEFEKEHCA